MVEAKNQFNWIIEAIYEYKDYKMYSQANHLDVLIKLRKDTLSEVDRLIVSYTYSENNLNDLGKV